MKEDLPTFAYILIVAPIICVLFLVFKSELLIPPGYDLAINGYVISRTLIIIFGLYLLTKLGYFILRNTKKD
ncbi:hypothetical protein GCM10010969_27550 [Saccharibacillus kuerlensis]|uniref:Uncharacterized protein n=1 Tax=Saccharibacillus kuerlensis TaxID=459527 RepID=A0ABQ2L7G2_9BACL|nr:hypothetical protein GCM10010969_27550 [Saccharibacillus kuerlensis]